MTDRDNAPDFDRGMQPRRHGGSAAPMWWGVCAGLAFLVAATAMFAFDERPRQNNTHHDEFAYSVQR